jgi:quercetin dioxygenase-like cupin family protein
MAIHHASPAEVFDLAPLGSNLKDARTTAIVKSEAFEVVRLVVHAGVEIKTHQVDGPITLHCLEGRALLGLPETTLELSGYQWVYLEGGVPHSIRGIEDTSLLLTILFPSGSSGRSHGKHAQPVNEVTSQKLEALLDEGLMQTFPASDPVAVCNPSTSVGITVRDPDKKDQ